MKMLACLDFSPTAPALLEKAVDMAKSKNAELVLFSVVEDFVDFGEGIPESVSQQLMDFARNSLEKARQDAKKMGLEVSTAIEYGTSPADTILDYAEKAKPDLIILGSRAKTTLDRFLIGSVASKVVSHAPCSVLVVR